MSEWKRLKIGQFLKERDGRYDPKDESVLGLKRLNKIDFSGEIHLSDKDSKTDMIVVEPGDFVISGINVSKGALAVYHGEKPITATIHYSSYVFDEKQIDIEYFKKFVRSQSFIQALKDQVKGGIKTEIKPKHFLPLEIDLPDIEIQKGIVSFFKRVEGDMDELGSEISSQIEYLNKFRQAVLQEAIEGKLSAEWRKQNPALISGENHASKLLVKIKAEKERLIKEGKIKKDKPLSPITDEKKPFALPEGWVWCRLGEVCTKITDGEHQTPERITRGKMLLSAKNIRDGFIDYTDVDYISEEDYEKCISRCDPKKNDILIVSVGATIGRTVILENDAEFALVRSVALIKPFIIESQFLRIFLRSPMGQDDIKGKAWGSAQPCFYLNKIKDVVLPIPPVAEQQFIVERVEKLMTMIDELEKQVTERKDQSEMLMQSVLREAFEN